VRADRFLIQRFCPGRRERLDEALIDQALARTSLVESIDVAL